MNNVSIQSISLLEFHPPADRSNAEEEAYWSKEPFIGNWKLEGNNVLVDLGD